MQYGAERTRDVRVLHRGDGAVRARDSRDAAGRKREIGIRKTLGATVQGVVLTMLLIDFAKPVLIANVIAWPFAWFVGQKYMEQFTQRGELTVWPFLLSLVITLGVAWASVGVQALRAATVKPANVLYAE